MHTELDPLRPRQSDFEQQLAQMIRDIEAEICGDSSHEQAGPELEEDS